MRNLIKIIITSVCLTMCLTSCGQNKISSNVRFFENTKAYDLAIAVEKGDLFQIEKIVMRNKALLNITSSSGSNVLTLSLILNKFESFKKLLELGADPNFINPYSKYSVLIESCRYFGSSNDWIEDNRYAELLLRYGANPNYGVEHDFVDGNGVRIVGTSPIFKASRLSLSLVKLLLSYHAKTD